MRNNIIDFVAYKAKKEMKQYEQSVRDALWALGLELSDPEVVKDVKLESDDDDRLDDTIGPFPWMQHNEESTKEGDDKDT